MQAPDQPDDGASSDPCAANPTRRMRGLTVCRCWSLSGPLGYYWVLEFHVSQLAVTFLASHIASALEAQASACGGPPSCAVCSASQRRVPVLGPWWLRSCTTRCSPRRVSRPWEDCFVDSRSRLLSRPLPSEDQSSVQQQSAVLSGTMVSTLLFLVWAQSTRTLA